MAKTKYRKKLKKKKVYFLKDPDGNEYRVENLLHFCKEHGLSQGNMSSVCSGRYSQHKGWTGTMEIEKKYVYSKVYERKGNIDNLKSGEAAPLEEVITKMRSRHNDYYDYSLVHEDYLNSSKPVKVICKVEGHGIFISTPKAHLHKNESIVRHCPKCIKEKIILRPKVEKKEKSQQKANANEGVINSPIRRYKFAGGGRITLGDSIDRIILLKLELQGYTRDDIIMWHDYDPISIIKWYPNRLDREDYRLHYVDIFVKKTNTVIYPFENISALKDTTMLKIRDQCLRDGFRFEMWHIAKGKVMQIYL